MEIHHRRAYIRVNGRLETTAPDVWATGECAVSPAFSHDSVDDSRIIRYTLAGGGRSTRNRLVPQCMFTDPSLAHIGLGERDAQRQGIAVRVGKVPVNAVLAHSEPMPEPRDSSLVSISRNANIRTVRRRRPSGRPG